MNRGPSFVLTMLFLASALLVSLGCNSEPKGPPKTKISGTVNLDGKPLPEGEIAFVKVDQGVNDVLPVKDGKFAGEASIGERKVEVRAYREAKVEGAGGYTPPDATATKENYIPPAYNTNSKLTAKIEEGKETPLAFDVTSK